MSEGNGTTSTAIRFDRPVTVTFGYREVELEPIRGLKAIRAFEEALTDEVHLLKERVESKVGDGVAANPEALLERGADQARLLLLGAPGTITEELLEESTAMERLGALTIILELNNLGRFAPFFAPEVLMDLGRMLRSTRTQDSAGESPQPNSSAPEPPGGTSGTT
jgi:hypothetical protein